MIVRLEARDSASLTSAREQLESLVRSWGHELVVDASASDGSGSLRDREGKVLDPLAVATLVISIPSAVLAVIDLADRIQKRRRAQELIEVARRLAALEVVVAVEVEGSTVLVVDLDPDRLLDPES